MATLFKNALVLTRDPPGATRAGVLVDRELIMMDGSDGAPCAWPGVAVVECHDSLMTPGFINGHIHLNQLLNRGFLEEGQALSTLGGYDSHVHRLYRSAEMLHKSWNLLLDRPVS